ncbi:tetratricopeptide repeat protein 16 [Trypanosoma theileri]|uniref:Tetratricopeptide repeat protein 16 n=1 Tax=Trypanosoma theileri TaxID=67003 RepID=A0A1X0P7U7_9TRYP|nr:tetratricopeptide repeat protein 16 [Trypanosoma theileri]ORC93004.1 tetratricopeptide repeat protein 16 [Trypanosoma theileri]
MDGKKSMASFYEKGEIMYQRGLFLMQRGLFREAINAFAKASFFVPQKPQPLITAAECYVSLCDFQGAVKQYRRSLWLLRPREKDQNEEGFHVDTLRFDMPLNPASKDDDVESFDLDVNEANYEEASFSQKSSRPVSANPFLSTRVSSRGRTTTAAGARCGDEQALTEAIQTRLAGILDALSMVLFNAKDYAQALRFADESLELRPHPQVELHRCAYLIALEREDDAEKSLEKHLHDNPKFSIESSSLLVHLYCLRQAFRHAKELLDKIPIEERQHPQVLLAQHIFDSSYSVFRQRSIDQSDFQGLTRCLTVFPEDAALLYERAKHHINKGMEKKAVPDLFRCIKVSDGHHKAAIELMTQTLFHLGSTVDGTNSIKDAIEYYSTSLIWQADNIPVLLARGDCYVKLEDYQRALQDFMRVESICPKYPPATQRIGFLHDVWGSKFHSKGKLLEAEREFSKAIATFDTEPLFYYHRACCRFDLNEPRYALRDVLSCQQLNPTDPIIKDFVYAHLGKITTNADVQEKNEVKLPELASGVSRRVMLLYGSSDAKRLRRKRNQEYNKSMIREEEEEGEAEEEEVGNAARASHLMFGTGKTSSSLRSVLKCKKATLSMPDNHAGSFGKMYSISPREGKKSA